MTAQWFEGFDGQVLLDDDYVWIVREGVPPTVLSGGSALCRVRRSAIRGARYRPATAASFGYIDIRPDYASGRGSHVDLGVVRFSECSNQRFAALGRFLGAEPDIYEAHEEIVVAIDELVRNVLDDLGGIATRNEIVGVVGEDSDVTVVDEGVIWVSLGSLCIAAGGSDRDAYQAAPTRIQALIALVGSQPANTGIKALKDSVSTTALDYLGSERLGTLWEAVASEAQESVRAGAVPPKDADVVEDSISGDSSEAVTPPSLGIRRSVEASATPNPERKRRDSRILTKVNERLREELDAREGIATHGELTNAVQGDLQTRGSHKSVIWGQAGGVRVALGGTERIPIQTRIDRIRLLDQVVRTHRAEHDVGDRCSCWDYAELLGVSEVRIAELWRSIGMGPTIGAVRTGSVNSSNSRCDESPDVGPREAPELIGSDSMASLAGDEVGGVEVQPLAGKSAAPPDARLSSRINSEKQIGAFSGNRTRVYLDCDGHRIKALYSPDDWTVEVTVAPILALRGARFDHPDDAASAVIAACRPGEGGVQDGWASWRIDDRSERSLGEVRQLRRAHR